MAIHLIKQPISIHRICMAVDGLQSTPFGCSIEWIALLSTLSAAKFSKYDYPAEFYFRQLFLQILEGERQSYNAYTLYLNDNID